MINDNIQIWFAKNSNDKIVTIDEVDKTREDTYYCPICGSKLIARQGDIMSWHFAHIDKSKCNNESIYHFWYKNKLLQQEDIFIIRADSDKEYICKEVLVEQTYKVGDRIYKPDLTVVCEGGEVIYFEFDYTNKKKLQDYIDLWIELGNAVVEIDVKTLMNYKKDKLPIFKALWYEGKCFNVKKGEDELYYDTIGKHKEELLKTNKDKFNKEKDELVKLDWLWNDVKRYKLGKVDIEHISDLIQSIENEKSREIVVKVLRKASCQNIIKDYINYNIEYVSNIEKTFDSDKITICNIKTPHFIYDRLFNLGIEFKYKDSNTINVNRVLFTKENINNLIDNIEKEIVEENNIIEEIKKLKKYTKNNYNYSNLCKYMILENEPYLNEYTEPRKATIYGIKNKYRLYLNCFPKSCYGEYIKISKYEDIINAHDLIKKKASYNTYELFCKEDILKIDNIAKELCEKFNDDNINIIFYIYNREYINIDIRVNGEYTDKITIYKDRNFYAINLYKHIFLLISLKVNKIKKYIQRIDYITSIINNLNETYKNNDITKEWSLKITNNNYISVYKDSKHIFYIDIIKRYFEENNKMTESNFIKKVNNITKHKILEYIYRETREVKYFNDFRNIRNYKKDILKDLRKSNFQISSIKPMCNKPYIILEYGKEISHIIFLSQHDYNNCKIKLDTYNIVTILNKDIVSNYEYYRDSVKNHMIVNTDEGKYDFINRNELVKSIIKSKIEENICNCDKKINLFYYKSRPLNKKYRNLNDFNFAKTIDILGFVNNKYSNKIHNEEINKYISELPYYISNINILKQKIFNQQDICNLFNLFFKTINTIQSDEINILLNIKYTNLNNDGYQPWLIGDFIEELYKTGFRNINNTKGEVI